MKCICGYDSEEHIDDEYESCVVGGCGCQELVIDNKMKTTILVRLIVEQDVPEISINTIRELIASGEYDLTVEQFGLSTNIKDVGEQVMTLKKV